MPSKENAATGEWSGTVVRSIVKITALFAAIGIALGYFNTDLSWILSGFRTGVAVSTLYVVYKIAQEVHHFREAR